MVLALCPADTADDAANRTLNNVRQVCLTAKQQWGNLLESMPASTQESLTGPLRAIAEALHRGQS